MVTYIAEHYKMMPYSAAEWSANCPKTNKKIYGKGYPKNGEEFFNNFEQHEPRKANRRNISLMFWNQHPEEIFLKINDGDDDYHAKQYTPEQIEQAKQDLEFLLLATDYTEMVEAAYSIGFDRD